MCKAKDQRENYLLNNKFIGVSSINERVRTQEKRRKSYY